MNRFVTSLRTRADGIRLASEQAPIVWTLRAQCAEAWDAVRVDVVPETRVLDIKQAALSLLLPDVDDLDGYVVKLHGFELRDESAGVQSTGAVDGSTLLITSRRRRPVR
jgi:hypothetical protein